MQTDEKSVLTNVAIFAPNFLTISSFSRDWRGEGGREGGEVVIMVV
jgi:hypothetical protein